MKHEYHLYHAYDLPHIRDLGTELQTSADHEKHALNTLKIERRWKVPRTEILLILPQNIIRVIYIYLESERYGKMGESQKENQ